MSLIETEALVLKSYGLSEADKIVVLLTRTEGVVRGVAKGAKRLKSRFGGALEPFSVVRLAYFQREERELVSISQVELIKSYFDMAGEPEFFEQFAYLVELLVEFAPPHDPNEKLYRMAKVCLETASEQPRHLAGIVVYFEFWILRLGGYLPSWSECDHCGRELTANEKTTLQLSFHLRCQTCQRHHHDRLIAAEERRVFQSILKLPPKEFVAFAADKEKNVREISAVLRRIINGVLGRNVSSKKSPASASLATNFK